MKQVTSVRFGIMLPIFVPGAGARSLWYEHRKLDFDNIRNVTLDAEKLGYHSVWLSDHLSREATKYRFECWTTLSALAQLTERIRLGTMVLCNLYRHPGLLAHMGATADVLSRGRLEFGIGAGWNEDECKEYGVDFPMPKMRLQKLKESVEIIRRLWTEEKVTYHGKHYHLDSAYCEPKPVQKPYPPMLIGGGGEEITLRIVAKYADKSNFGGPVEVMSRKLNTLKKYCSSMGRDYDAIEKTCSIQVVIHSSREEYMQDMKKRYLAEARAGSFEKWIKEAESTYVAGTPDECLRKIEEYMSLGVSLFVIWFGDMPRTNGMELFAEHVIQKTTRKGI